METLLIAWSEIAAQPALWQAWASGDALEEALAPLPCPAPQQPLVLLGEGSSYTVLAMLKAGLLASGRLTVPCKLLRPRELSALLQAPPAWLQDAFVVAVSQSGRTQSLHEALAMWQQRMPHPPQGCLFTNHPEPETLATPLTPLALKAGAEPCVAALKTVSGFLLLLQAYACYCFPSNEKATLPALKAEWHTLAAWATVQLPLWQQTSAFADAVSALLPSAGEAAPLWLLLGSPSLVPLLLEGQLKLTECCHWPVQAMEAETFKHGYKAILSPPPAYPARPPQRLYLLPPDAVEAQAVLGDAVQHQQGLHCPQPPMLFVGDAETLATLVWPEALAAAHRLPLPLPSGVSPAVASLPLLVWVQCLAYHLNARLGLHRSHLQKFI